MRAQYKASLRMCAQILHDAEDVVRQPAATHTGTVEAVNLVALRVEKILEAVLLMYLRSL